MRVLPDVTRPASSRVERRHSPRSRDWRRFRPCLRWEFGFTCAFCLLHEADLDEDGAEGAGRMSIEHRERRASHPLQAGAYANCFLACRYCNEARHTRPTTDAGGRSLLDPVATAWGDHFRADHDRVVANEGDRDAEYTHIAYDLDDVRKMRKRRRRRERLPTAMEIARDGPRLAAKLLDLAACATSKARRDLLTASRVLHFEIARAREELARYRLIPGDADRACSCDAKRSVPSSLLRQTVEAPET